MWFLSPTCPCLTQFFAILPTTTVHCHHFCSCLPAHKYESFSRFYVSKLNWRHGDAQVDHKSVFWNGLFFCTATTHAWEFLGSASGQHVSVFLMFASMMDARWNLMMFITCVVWLQMCLLVLVLWNSRLSHHLRCRHPTGALVGVLAAPLPIQLPANSSEKAVGDGPSPWILATHVGDQNGVPGSGHLGSERVNGRSFSPCNSAFQVNKEIFFKNVLATPYFNSSSNVSLLFALNNSSSASLSFSYLICKKRDNNSDYSEDCCVD